MDKVVCSLTLQFNPLNLPAQSFLLLSHGGSWTDQETCPLRTGWPFNWLVELKVPKAETCSPGGVYYVKERLCMVNSTAEKEPFAHTKGASLGKCIAPLKNKLKKAPRDMECSVCGDKGINFLEYFLTKEEFYFCLCRDTLSLRDSGKKWVWQGVELFSFFPSDEVFRDSQQRFK